MMNEVRSPFQNGPRTEITSGKDGKDIYNVHIAAKGPRMTKLADWLALGAAAATGIGAIYGATQLGEASAWQFGALALSPVPAYFLVKYSLYEAFKRHVRVVFTPDRFTVHGIFGPKVFDRNMPHKFTLYPHRLADREERKLAFRESQMRGRWWGRALKRYFSKSYNLSFEYMGQRNDMLTIYGENAALDILTGLNTRDELMDGQARNGRGHVLEPETEWSDQAGELTGSM